eukprot:1807788-Pyramimonas_sp.AAC.1
MFRVSKLSWGRPPVDYAFSAGRNTSGVCGRSPALLPWLLPPASPRSEGGSFSGGKSRGFLPVQ